MWYIPMNNSKRTFFITNIQFLSKLKCHNMAITQLELYCILKPQAIITLKTQFLETFTTQASIKEIFSLPLKRLVVPSKKGMNIQSTPLSPNIDAVLHLPFLNLLQHTYFSKYLCTKQRQQQS